METNGDRGFTLIELMLVVTIISIIAGIAVPGFLRARMFANESSAIASLRVTATAQIAYSATCGNGGYASSFLVLGTPIGGAGQAFISDDLGKSVTPQKAVFNFTMTAGAAGPGPTDCQGTATLAGYYATAQPMVYGTSGTGTRAFAVARGGAIWQHIGPLPPTEPFVQDLWTFPIQ
jgi:prepilin-type N-terminal cleavage/methylation domain-containing protein